MTLILVCKVAAFLSLVPVAALFVSALTSRDETSTHEEREADCFPGYWL